MNYKIPLLPKPFKVETAAGSTPTPEQLSLINGIEIKLDKETMATVIEKMHEFYVEGRRHIEDALPKLIELGAMTQRMYDELCKNSPAINSVNNFTDYLLDPFVIIIPTDKAYTEGTFGMTMECEWDIEHGVGVWFENWKPVRVGFAETAYP